MWPAADRSNNARFIKTERVLQQKKLQVEALSRFRLSCRIRYASRHFSKKFHTDINTNSVTFCSLRTSLEDVQKKRQQKVSCFLLICNSRAKYVAQHTLHWVMHRLLSRKSSTNQRQSGDKSKSVKAASSVIKEKYLGYHVKPGILQTKCENNATLYNPNDSHYLKKIIMTRTHVQNICSWISYVKRNSPCAIKEPVHGYLHLGVLHGCVCLSCVVPH